MTDVKLVVLYPSPKDVAVFEKVYRAVLHEGKNLKLFARLTTETVLDCVFGPIKPQTARGFSGLSATVPREIAKRRILSFVGALAPASRVGCNLLAIPTQLHAAPASCPFLAGIMEMQHALGALADALSIHGRE
jgi:hypothetical protein